MVISLLHHEHAVVREKALKLIGDMIRRPDGDQDGDGEPDEEVFEEYGEEVPRCCALRLVCECLAGRVRGGLGRRGAGEGR